MKPGARHERDPFLFLFLLFLLCLLGLYLRSLRLNHVTLMSGSLQDNSAVKKKKKKFLSAFLFNLKLIDRQQMLRTLYPSLCAHSMDGMALLDVTQEKVQINSQHQRFYDCVNRVIVRFTVQMW